VDRGLSLMSPLSIMGKFARSVLSRFGRSSRFLKKIFRILSSSRRVLGSFLSGLLRDKARSAHWERLVDTKVPIFDRVLSGLRSKSESEWLGCMVFAHARSTFE